MEINIPKTSYVFSSLLRADFTTQWRNRRSFILVLIVPVLILSTWKGLVATLGGGYVLSSCITIGLMAIGLMGYSNSIARDRDKGIFQRLRVAPLPIWTIMCSRLAVQMAMIVLVTATVFIAGYKLDGITMTAPGYALAFFTAFIGGAVYLALGQVIVGLVTNPETVNSTSRLVYLVFMMVGMLADLGKFSGLSEDVQKMVHYSPYGTVKTMLAGSVNPGGWGNEATMALLANIVYATVFAVIGIKKFKWSAGK